MCIEDLADEGELILRIYSEFPGSKNTHQPDVNILEYFIIKVITGKPRSWVFEPITSDVMKRKIISIESLKKKTMN